MDNLLPCPFCGSHQVSRSTGKKGDHDFYYIECEDCASMAYPDVWNRRANDALMADDAVKLLRDVVRVATGGQHNPSDYSIGLAEVLLRQRGYAITPIQPPADMKELRARWAALAKPGDNQAIYYAVIDAILSYMAAQGLRMVPGEKFDRLCKAAFMVVGLRPNRSRPGMENALDDLSDACEPFRPGRKTPPSREAIDDI